MSARLHAPAWLAVLALSVAVTGCSGSDDGDGTPDAVVSPGAVGIDNVGSAEDPLRIGVVVSVRSPSGEGQDWLEGAQGARVAEYRLDAGGGSVDLEVVDDAGTANGAATAVEQLVESGVAGIVMATGGSHVQGALESSAASETPILLPYYRTDGALPDNAFRTAPTQSDVDAALLAALEQQGLDKPFVLTADGLSVDGVGSADALEYRGRNVEKLARRIAGQRVGGSIDSVVIAAAAANQAEISSALRGQLEDLPVLLTPEAQTRTFSTGLEQDAGTIASRFTSAGVDASDTTTMTSTARADAVAAFFAALRLAAGDPEATDLFGDAPLATAALDADTASHDAVMAIAAAAAEAGSTQAPEVLESLSGLEVGAAQGLAGPPLDFSDSDARDGEDVVPLLATVQDPGVRPPAADGSRGARLYWFALDPRVQLKAEEADVEGPPPPGEQRPLGSRYELEERLGIGAMGEVWRAMDRQTGRHVAAKVLRAELARDTDIVTRFIQERSILLGLTHPNIVRVRDLVVEGERLAIVMDLVEGGDLRKHLRDRGPVAPAHAVPLACVVLDALASAHEAGCLHRDVKPDNVLLLAGDVTRPQDARLSDFSIARLAHESTVQSTGLLGTPGYMPPELFRDGQFSAASDVYATGVLLYELLGGRTPFAGSGTAHTIGSRHVSAAPPPLPVAAPLWAVLEQMLDKDPRVRLRAAATAAVLRDLPEAVLDTEPLPPQPVPESWQLVDQTVLRGASAPGRHAAPPGAPPTAPPVGPPVGAAASATPVPGGSRADRTSRRTWVPWAAGAAAVVLLVAGLAVAAATRGGGPATAGPPDDPPPAGSAPVVSAQLTDPPLPIGLTIARSAQYDAATDELELTITYSAGSAAAEGPFLEVLPRGAGDLCPLAVWQGTEPQLSTTSTTGVRSDCPGFAVEVPPLPPQGREQVSVVVSEAGIDLADDPDGVQSWLESVSSLTRDALAGPSVRDDQFPVQRTRDIWVEVSPFSVSLRDEIRVEIGPVFVTGDEGPAFFDSTQTADPPSVFLEKLAGGYDGVRLLGCSAVQVSAELRVGAARPSNDCTIGAEVGKVLSAEDTVTITGAGS